MTAEIESLLLDSDYGEDYLCPTDNAMRRGQRFLQAAMQDVQGQFPFGSPVPDGLGGFRVYWKKPGRNVQLNVPASDSQPLSVFWRDGRDHSLDQDSTTAHLAERLTWFSGN